MNHFERRDLKIRAETKRRVFFNDVRNQLWQAAAEMRRLKNVLENAAQILPRERVGENWHRAVAKIERA